MIVEKLTVSGFRRFAQEFAFTPDPRFTVVHAPNGTGKSTLLDGIYFGLLERHSVTGKDAEQRFRSIGRELTPTIEIDFAVDGTHYRLRKVFLGKTKSASLQRLEAGRYVPLKDGGAADDFARELLFAKAPGRGAIDPSEHLGLAHVLWAPARATFGDVPSGAGDQIRAMLGGASIAVTEGERVVQQRATTEFERFFTAEGAYRTRVGSADIPALEAKAAAAREAESEARRQYVRLEQLATAYTDRQAEAERMHVVRGQLRADIEAMKHDVAVYCDLKLSAERASRAEVEARLAYERVTAVITSVAALRAQRVALEAEREARANELAELRSTAGPLHERFARARTAAEDAGKAIAALQQRADDVTAAQSYVESCALVDRLAALVATYDTTTSTLADLRAAASSVFAPARAELETLREAAAQVQVLNAAIAESALSLEIDAQSNVTIDVITGQRPGVMTLAAGAATTITAADGTVVVDVPGLGRIRARGADGAASARKKLQPFVALLDAARARYGTSAVPELAARTECAEELARSISQSEKAIAELLGDSSIEIVRESLASARARIASFDSVHPRWREVRPDAYGLRAEFDRDLQTVTDAYKLAGIELASAEQLKNDVDTSIALLTLLEAELAADIAVHAAQLRALEADGLDDIQRGAQAQRLALTWAAAQAQVAEVAVGLARFTESPEVALARLESAEREAGVAYEKALEDATTFRAQLDLQAALGSYAKLVAAEEYAAHCESDLVAAKHQAAAIACLCRAFDRIASERLASVIGPVTAASTRYLTRIVGAPLGDIAIGEGLAPTGVIDAASGQRLAIDGTLSSGEKEQVYLATRLALAEVIAKDRGRQLFVIDDAAIATDPSRLRRFVGILEDLSREHFQVIVTTCDPSRYLGVRDAKRVDLSAALLSEYAA
jgi:hypothetical protein